MKFFKSLYIQPRFFYSGLVIILLFGCSYFVPLLFPIAQLSILMVLLVLMADILGLYASGNKIKGQRILPDKFSNGDDNRVTLKITNSYAFPVTIAIIDEVPVQFQMRHFKLLLTLQSLQEKSISYTLKPQQRGEYHFGAFNVYVNSKMGFIARRYRFEENTMVKTYPSFMQLRKYELLNVNNNLREYGLKKIRRIGHTMEFEQIKDYVMGDDLRTINWKATAKKNNLMVNQFQDERSQPIYAVIDKGRVMQMPFDGLSLLDYAINATLVLSSIALKKQDKVGIMAFSKKVENRVVAQRRNSQMHLILEALYNIKTDTYESDFSRLYADIKRHITQRCLLLLYTNFETLDSLQRQLPSIKAIAKNHLVVVIFFKNTELKALVDTQAKTIQQVYDKVIAEKFDFEKRLIVQELKKYGIYSILTTPENLTVDTINEYLEIKARGLI